MDMAGRGGGKGWDDGASNMETNITIYKRQPTGICMTQGTQTGAQ